MTKSALPFMPVYFDRYINQVDNIELMDALTQTATFELLFPMPELAALGDRRYAPGKWTVRDILQHIIDTERIMSYRALRISRNDQTPLPGFDEAAFADYTLANQRTLADLSEEFTALRQANLALFRNMDDAMLLRSAVCSNQPISALALGFVLVGHPLHHATVVRERYLPLLYS